MADVIPLTGRSLSGAERAAFQHLGLSPGNWAALVAAPFFNRPGLRPPDLQQRGDGLHLETLRRELRTRSGLSEETGRFWRQLGAAPGPEAADLATRLLAWHLATDLPFEKREQVLRLFLTAAGEFTTGAHPRAAQALGEDVRLLVDYSLPCPVLPTDSAPRWVHVPTPSPDGLDAIARALTTPACAWPATPAAPEQCPALVRVLGESVADWWGRPHPGRSAVERGMASLSFSERERLYGELAREWDRAHQPAGGAGASGGTFAEGIREWVDAVRKAVRHAEPAPEPRKSGVVRALPPAAGTTSAAGGWRCTRCGAETPAGGRECRGCHHPRLPAIELRAAATGKVLRLEDGMRVGRSEYRDVFGLPAAGLAAADQFEVACDAARGVWLVRPLAGARRPTEYQGTDVGPAGSELAADGVISVGGKLELVVRFV